jgi:hypothetical protein
MMSVMPVIHGPFIIEVVGEPINKQLAQGNFSSCLTGNKNEPSQPSRAVTATGVASLSLRLVLAEGGTLCLFLHSL